MPWEPITTGRLSIRPMSMDDLDAFVGRRNDPDVARYLDWTLPVSRSFAAPIIEASTALDGPTVGEWWIGVIEDRASGEPLGDLVVHLEELGRRAEVGYALAPAAWGKGFATEALGGLVDRLLADHPLTRIYAKVHRDNAASAVVLERTGFLYEGTARNAHWAGDVNYDDLIYALTPEDRASWLARARQEPVDVRLVAIDHTNLADVERLQTHPTQLRFVAPIEGSFADALFPRVVDGAARVPVLRAVEADGEVVGFVMLAARTQAQPEPYLWRMLVDRLHQRRGVGRRAMDLIIDLCRADGATGLTTRWVEGVGGPARFYRGLGFEPTGRVIGGEIEGRLTLG